MISTWEFYPHNEKNYHSVIYIILSNPMKSMGVMDEI